MAVRLCLDGPAQLRPDGPVARHAHGAGPRDVAAAAEVRVAVADEEGVGHAVEQGAEDALGGLSGKRERGVGFLDQDQSVGMFARRANRVGLAGGRPWGCGLSSGPRRDAPTPCLVHRRRNRRTTGRSVADRDPLPTVRCPANDGIGSNDPALHSVTASARAATHVAHLRYSMRLSTLAKSSLA